MRIPPFLQKGDLVAIVSPGKFIQKNELEQAITFFNSWGLKVTLGKNVLSRWNRFAGSDEERLSDFQWAIDNNDIKAIVCARGGYGSSRIISRLNFSAFMTNPKWIIGYSDITVFHNVCHSQLSSASLHATMPLDMTQEDTRQGSIKKLRSAMFGHPLYDEFETHILNKYGCSEGELVGGNLSVFNSLLGTPYDIDTDGKILFLEDLCEELYHLDRMFHQLDAAKKLKNLRGLVLGGFTDMTDVSGWFGESKNAYSLINEVVNKYSYPVAFSFPAGHQKQNYPLLLGAHYLLEVRENRSILKQKAP